MPSGVGRTRHFRPVGIEHAIQTCDDVVSQEKYNSRPYFVLCILSSYASYPHEISMSATETQLAKTSIRTPVELGINEVPFPPTFVARYMAMDASECWYVFDTRPTYDSGEWVIRSGHWYEIGIDGVDGNLGMPEFAKGLPAKDTLFTIGEAA